MCFVLIKIILFYFLIGITWHPPNLPGHKVFETGEGLPAIYVRVSIGSLLMTSDGSNPKKD